MTGANEPSDPVVAHHITSTRSDLYHALEVEDVKGGNGNGFIYVVGFSTGTVKAGKTENPRKRIKSHVRDAKKFNTTVEGVWLSGLHKNYAENERQLLKLLGVPTHGSEYFTHVEFTAAVELAEKHLNYLVLDVERGVELVATNVKSDTPTLALGEPGRLGGMSIKIRDTVVQLCGNADSPTCTVAQVMDHLDIHANKAATYLRRLALGGHIRQNLDGSYRPWTD
jgi:hypothetical protein